MKRTLFIASLIGLFMATTLDLQAHHRGRVLPRPVRAGIAAALMVPVPLPHHRDRYVQHQYRYQNQYHGRQGGQIAREIRNNERRIWKLEQRIDRLGRYYGDNREIYRLEQEINWLQRRNDFLRNRLY
jgi:hypothetical protein